jgi:hypothetical protein
MNLLIGVLLTLTGEAMAIEEPEYKILSQSEEIEVRQYGSTVVAETQVTADFEGAGNQAFRILAGYIFGGNQSKTKISMTAPVVQEKVSKPTRVSQSTSPLGYRVQFTMPKQYTLTTLPVPDDTRVELKQLPPRKVAVFAYSGSWSEEHYLEKLSTFKIALEKGKLRTKGEPTLARFNSPFQLWFLRRNEIWIEVE